MSKHRMRALSVKQPWASALVDGHKTVENRTWAPRDMGVFDDWILIAASAVPANKQAHLEAVAWSGTEGAQAPSGAIVGAVSFAGIVEARNPEPGETGPPRVGSVLAYAEGMAGLVDRWAEQAQFCPWWHGPKGWVVAEAIPFPTPIPAKGKMGLWLVSDEIQELARGQIMEAL